MNLDQYFCHTKRNFKQIKVDQNEATNKSCLNCGYALQEDQQYCRNCGQENKSYRLEFWVLIQEIIESAFNFDSRFWNTMKNIWKPSYLTRAYAEGKRQSYISPGRLFFYLMVIHFALLRLVINPDLNMRQTEDISEISQSQDRAKLQKLTEAVQNKTDSLTLSYNQREHFPYIASEIDTALFGNLEISHLDTFPSFDVEFGSYSIQKYGITYEDAATLDPDEIITKYKIQARFEKLITKQFIKFYQDRKSATNFILANTIWCVIMTIILTSLIAKLIYIRHRFYYTEHLVLQMQIHSFCFAFVILFTLIPGLILGNDHELTSQGLGLSALIGGIYYIGSLKIFYGQSWFRTLLKFFILGFSYLLSFCIFAFFVALVSFAIF